MMDFKEVLEGLKAKTSNAKEEFVKSIREEYEKALKNVLASCAPGTIAENAIRVRLAVEKISSYADGAIVTVILVSESDSDVSKVRTIRMELKTLSTKNAAFSCKGSKYVGGRVRLENVSETAGYAVSDVYLTFTEIKLSDVIPVSIEYTLE
jgi:vacuolar-type H+-ATPase subunit E/Vma4